MNHFQQAAVEPLPENLYVPFTPSVQTNTTPLQISKEDTVVYLTVEDKPKLLGVFYIEELTHSPDLYWRIRSSVGALQEAKEDFIKCAHNLAMKIPVPIRIKRTPRGYKTLMVARHPSNCQVHTLSYLEAQLPELYKQLQL